MPNTHHQEKEKEVSDLIRPMPYGIWSTVLWVMLILVITTIIASHFVQYSDVVEAPVQLAQETPSVHYIAPRQGKLETIFVAENDWVDKGEMIALFTNTADYSSILLLDSLLNLPSYQQAASPSDLLFPEQLSLGELSPDFHRLRQALAKWKIYHHQSFVGQKVVLFGKQQAQIRQINKAMQQQIKNLEKETDILKERFDVTARLYQEKIESKTNLQTAEMQYLLAKSALENKVAEQLQNQLRIDQLEEKILLLQEQDYNNKNDYYLAFHQHLQTLKSNIAIWKEQYMIISGNAGQVSFEKKWTQHSPVQKGESLFIILPKESTDDWFVHGLLPAHGAGKVQPGMDVQIRLDAYPYKEFGVLEGEVLEVAPHAQADMSASYAIDISLPQQRTTSYQKEISFKTGMIGTARILTKKRSLLSRLFDLLRASTN